jgi:hypothetical protein
VRTLTEIMNTNQTDKGTVMGEAHSYTPRYERWFSSMRDKPLRLLEIGVCDPRFPGASLQGWYEYFPNATIFGYDIVDAHHFDNERIHTFVGDQSSPADLTRFAEFSAGAFDIIIDDGSHQDRHQQASLAFLFPHVKPGGQYVIEDLHVSPNTLHMLRRMQRGLPGERLGGKARLLSVARALSSQRSPYISTGEIDGIVRDSDSLDLVCDGKLARFSKQA